MWKDFSASALLTVKGIIFSGLVPGVNWAGIMEGLPQKAQLVATVVSSVISSAPQEEQEKVLVRAASLALNSLSFISQLLELFPSSFSISETLRTTSPVKVFPQLLHLRTCSSP